MLVPPKIEPLDMPCSGSYAADLVKTRGTIPIVARNMSATTVRAGRPFPRRFAYDPLIAWYERGILVVEA
jgi:hypothetical protein